MSANALSPEEAISQFCGVTGADEERAKGLLEACDWNLELAVNMHVDTDDGRANQKATSSSAASSSAPLGPASARANMFRPSTSRASATPAWRSGAAGNRSIHIDDDEDDDDDVADESKQDNSSRNQTNSRRANRNQRHPRGRVMDGASSGGTAAASSSSASNNYSYSDNSDNVRPPIPPIRQVLVHNSDVAGYSQDLPQRRYNTRTGAMSDVYDAFRDFQAEAQWQEMANHQEITGETNNSSLMQNDISNSNPLNRGRTLQDLFRPPLEIMFRGSLSSARENGTQQNKWLLVNIQNGREFACQTLNRDVWSNQTVKDILKEHFIFWQVYHDSFEGSRFLQFYNVSTFPHVSIIDPRTGEQMKSWPISIDHNSFCDSVIEFLTEHPSPDGSSDVNTMKKLRVKEEADKDVGLIEDDDDCVLTGLSATGGGGKSVISGIGNSLQQSSTLYDQSEEAQLEAAIKASLQETKIKSSFLTENSNSSKTYIDEDSYIDAMESDDDKSQQANIKSSSGKLKATANDNNAFDNNLQTTRSEFSGVGRTIAATINNNHNKNKTSSSSHSTDENNSKNSNNSSNGNNLEEKKKVSLDEYKKYLGVEKEKFSDLVIRYPDGNREQFKFPSDSLMKALFVLLTSRGYGLDQFNYVTNFPRRLIHEMPSTDTLIDAKLIRETIFIERKLSD